jgi:F-type H+-transporting ATPase subunit a
MLHVSLAPEALFSLGGVSITNTMLTAFISSIIILVTLVWIARRLTIKPQGGLPGFVEALVAIVLDQAEQVYGSREVALKYFPLIASLFIFVWCGNTLGLIPGINTIELHGAPIFRSITTDLNTTIGLAIVSVVLTQVYAIKVLGFKANLHRYIVPGSIGMSVLGGLEFFLELTRLISFSFRLFGNIFAGEVLLIVMASLVPVLGPTPFWGFEIFIAFIQAFVFAMLTMVFIAIAITPPMHGDESHELKLNETGAHA